EVIDEQKLLHPEANELEEYPPLCVSNPRPDHIRFCIGLILQFRSFQLSSVQFTTDLFDQIQEFIVIANPSSKYQRFVGIALPDRQWPNNIIEKPPIWMSTDLRDGNQALIDPMNVQTKRSEEHTSELQSRENLVCRLLLEKKNAAI